MKSRILPSTVALAMLVGCGSTVQQRGLAGGPERSGAESAGVAGGDQSSIAPAEPTPSGEVNAELGSPGGEPARTSATGSSGTSTGSGSGTTASMTGRGTSRGAGTTQPAVGRLGPGVSATKVRLGFQYVDTGSGTGSVLGEDVSVGDPEAQARAVTAWINKNGGMGGRQLETVPYGAPYSGYVSNPQNEYNRICTYFTEDEKVFGVAVYVPDETLIDCLAKRDLITVADGYSMDRQVHDRYARHYYAPGSMSQDRGAEVGVQGLHEQGWFKGAVIGLVRYDTGVYERAERSLTAALARKGLKIKTTFTVSAADTSSATRDVSAAVLRMAADGVTHVHFLDNSGGIAYTFMTNAEPQGYRPFYGLTTNNAPSALRQLAPAEQLKKATAVSWWSGDVGPEETEATPPALPSSRALCLRIMAEAGVDLAARAAKGSALITCDQLFFFKALFDRASTPASEALEVAANALGSAYTSTLTYRTTIARGRHDGATITRILKFDAGCACWKYVTMGPTA